MPIYEFHCRKCDEDFEELVSITSPNGLKCPNCSSKEIERILSIFGFKSAESFTTSSPKGCSDCSATSCHGCSS